MDMVGGDPFKNKSILHVTETPWSLPSFVTDVGAALADVIRTGAANYADSGDAPDAAVIETRAGEPGTRNQFLADVTPYAAGSDHDDYDSSTVAVPSLYLRDWPDIYIHTDHDTLQQIDPTKLRRVALLGAAAGYVYATLDTERSRDLLPFYTSQSEIRLAQLFQHAQQVVADPKLDADAAWYEARNLMSQGLGREVATLSSLLKFAGSDAMRWRRRRHLPIRCQISIPGSIVRRGLEEQRVRSPKHPGRGTRPRRRLRFASASSDRLPIRTTMFLKARLSPERLAK